MGCKGDSAAIARLACLAAGCLVLANCSGGVGSRVDPRYGVSASPRVVQPGEPVPKGGGVYRVGKPYVIAGRVYTPREDRSYREEGLASWYGEDFHGRLTANGEVFDMESISAAHPTLPIPSYVRVTNLRNGRSIVARVNDRGPYHKNRVIDVSQRAARLLEFHGHGVTRVRVEYVGAASLAGSDDRKLEATLRRHGPAPAPSIMLASATAPAARRPSGSTPVPQSRPFARGDDDGEPVVQRRREQPAPSRPSELTASARIERTLGPAPAMAWVTGPSGTPSAGARAPEPVSAYASRNGAAGPAFMSGRGLY
jgi:rare lipoprotein A